MSYKKQLTVLEAIEQGFTDCGHSKLEWQTCMPLSDVEDRDFEDRDLFLLTKESSVYSIDDDFIKDELSELISEYEAEETGRDDDAISDAIKEVDFTTITKAINNKLAECRYWKLTDIKLTK